MKGKSLRIRPEAQEEINATFEWYYQRSPRAADAFLTEVGTTLAQIASQPQLCPVFTKNTRKRALRRFPYSVIFQDREEMILVVAIAHAKRRPGYWSNRL